MAFAAPQRDLYWQVDTTLPGGIGTYVDSALPTHDADFLLTVECSAYPGEVYSSADGTSASPQVGTIYGYPVVRVDQQPWLLAWPAASTLTFTLTYVPTGLSMTNMPPLPAEQIVVTVPAGSAPAFFGDVFGGGLASWDITEILEEPVTDTYTYNAMLTASDSGAYAFSGPQTGTTGTMLTSGPLTEAVNPLIGTYTVTAAPPAGWQWVNTTVELIADDFVAGAREDFVYTAADVFVLEEIPDTFTYNLYVNGPDGYAVTGPAPGVTDYMATDDVLADLLGEYTIEAAPTGFHWMVNPILVTEDMFTLQAPAKAGLRSSGAKEDFVYNATIEFVLEEDYVPTYTVNMTTVPAGYITPATLGPVTDPADIYGTYTPTDVSTTGYWTPASLTIDADTEWVADGDDWVFNQEFVWTEVDSYTYNAMLEASDGMAYAFTGPQNGTTGVMMTSGPLLEPVNPLIGIYTVTDPPPAGFEWVNTTVELTADDFMMPAKEDFVYSAYGLFQLQQGQELLNYTVIVSAENFLAYSVTGPVSGTTTYSGSSTNVNTLLGDYTITSPPPAGFLWVATTITVGAGDFVYYDEDTRICIVQFQLEEELQPITYTLNIAIDDTVFPGGPYTINGNPYVTSIVDNDDQVNDLLGDYLISDPPAGYHWEVNPITVADGDFVGNVASIEFVLVEDEPGNPVVLASFTATLTGQFYVQLSWTSQSESQMMGYRVYRNTSAEQNSAMLIDHPMIPATNTSTTQNYTVVDEDVLIGQTYYYWLEAVDYNSSSFHGPVSVTVTGNVPPVLPEVTEMYNAYPNPFKANGSTNIEVSLKAGDTGTLTIYNVIGQIVKTVNLTEGNHMVTWNGRDSRGNACGSGIYFYKLSTQTMNQTKKMVIVK